MLKATSFVAAALALAPAAMATVQAGPFTNPANGHQYYLLNPATWTASQSEAVTLGGHLVTINDAAENDYLLGTFLPLIPQTNHALWTGLTDATTEGTFAWVSGEPLGYTKFGPGEPNNDPGFFDPAGEDYVAYILYPYNFVGAKDWNDVTVNGSDRVPHGVVEVVPEPGSLAAMTITGCALLTRRRRHA